MGRATQVDLSKINTNIHPKRILHNLVGEKIWRLTVNEYYGISDKKQIYWKCICECGNEVIVKTADLTAGLKKVVVAFKWNLECQIINMDAEPIGYTVFGEE